mgnify:CR=1 FL=1
MPSVMSKKALDMGLITKKQYSNLPPKLLEAIAKKKLADTHKMPDGTVMTGKTHSANSKPVKSKSSKKKK